jgi:putative endonuclease
MGATSDLSRRAFEHREGALHGFTKKYNVKRLVWYEAHESIVEALRREKAIKHYSRAWKIAPIEAENPDWLDLHNRLNW